MSFKITLNLTTEQDEAFKQLKNRIVKTYGINEANDSQIYRFLKGRNFVVKQAEDMLIKYFEWKRTHGIETILKDYETPEILEKYLKFTVFGYDQEGYPSIYMKLGAVDYKGLLKSVGKFEILKHVTYFFVHTENLLGEISQKIRKPIDKWNVVMDVENFPFFQAIHKPTIELILDAFYLYESKFPERLKRCFVINASAPFFIMYNIIKPILSGATLQKTTFFGKDGWKEELVGVADPDDLPAFLGGNKTDPDGNPMCHQTVSHCGMVPEHYYLKNVGQRLSMKPDVVTYDLGRRSKVDIVFDVVEPGFYIEWEFASNDNDIAFELSYKAKRSSKMKPISLIESQRVKAHTQSEIGMYLCRKTGVYILTLDNSYSWLRQKKIFCRTSLIPASKQENVQ